MYIENMRILNKLTLFKFQIRFSLSRFLPLVYVTQNTRW